MGLKKPRETRGRFDLQCPFTKDNSRVCPHFWSSLLLAIFSSLGGRASLGPATSVTVIDEVIVAGFLGDRRGCVRDLDVFQVQETELDFHAE